jgi:hypothetical protein
VSCAEAGGGSKVIARVSGGYYNEALTLAALVNSIMPFDRAETLDEAYRACQPAPLRGDSLKFYTELDAETRLEAIKTVKAELGMLAPREFGTLLFTGHRGCGKSTELRKIEQDATVSKDYRVLYFEVDSFVDINDTDYTDLYLLLVTQISEDLVGLGLKPNTSLLKDFRSWFTEIVSETEQAMEVSVGAEANLELKAEIPLFSKLMAKLLAQVKSTEKQKKTIRETLRRNIGQLQESINNFLNDAFGQVQQQGYAKGFLLVFDNLDRVIPEVGDKLYFDYSAQLQSLNCTIIYTVPISAVYSARNLHNTFREPHVLPMVDLYDLEEIDDVNLRHSQEAVEKFADVIHKRMNVDKIFEDIELLHILVTFSGGCIRQLVQMTGSACMVAMSREHQQITQKDVDRAIKKEQFNFERIIPFHHYPLLVRVCEMKQVEQNEDSQTMLSNLSILTYEGDRQWSYVNPVIKKIPAFLEAMRDVHE